jgi:hypothetical protein
MVGPSSIKSSYDIAFRKDYYTPKIQIFIFDFRGNEAQWKARQLKVHCLTLLYARCTLQRNSQLQHEPH